MSVRIPLSAPDIGEAEIDAVTAVLRTSQLSLGPELEAFEAELARAHDVADAVAVSSGTAALHLALVTLGIGPADEVVVPSFAFIAVANAVAYVGATPVFADVDPRTLNLSPATVETVITARTRAIVVVHTFGVPAEMAALRTLADRHGLLLIEDACEALGAAIVSEAGRRPAGSFGDLAVLGFYPNKQITTGEGGAVLVRSPEQALRLRSLRNQGRSASAGWLQHAEIGFNYRLSELACSLGRAQLKRLPEILELRRLAAQRYHQLLGSIAGVELPPLSLPYGIVSWFVYVVRIPTGTNRELVREGLMAQGIATGMYFPPIHRQPAWKGHSSAKRLLPVTEAEAQRTLALPFFNRITQEQQEEVALCLARLLPETP